MARQGVRAVVAPASKIALWGFRLPGGILAFRRRAAFSDADPLIFFAPLFMESPPPPPPHSQSPSVDVYAPPVAPMYEVRASRSRLEWQRPLAGRIFWGGGGWSPI
jgi:hypothetical protein